MRSHRPGAHVLAKVARPGLVAHSILYATIALLALQVAANGRHRQADGTGAIQALARQRYGGWLLVVMTSGFVALALWRLAQTIWGDPVSGSGPKARATYAVKVFVYGSLAVSSIHVLLGTGGVGSNSDEQAKSWTARLLALPYGRQACIAVGVFVVLSAVHTLWSRGFRASFMDQLDRRRFHHSAERLIARLGTVGYIARSVVFAIIGVFLVRAAIVFDPDEAHGLSQTLQELAASEWRPLLWCVAIGLFAFSLLSLALAQFRRIE